MLFHVVLNASCQAAGAAKALVDLADLETELQIETRIVLGHFLEYGFWGIFDHSSYFKCQTQHERI